MCTKHKECCSSKTAPQPAQQHASCCGGSDKHVHADEHHASHCHASTQSCCSSGDSPNDDDDDPERRSGQYQQRWTILGMDCPSCARKVETAVKQLADIQTAKVIFSTEKLVVNYDHAETEQKIEAAVRASGFRLQQTSHTSSQVNQSTPWYRDSETQRILGIGLGIAIAALAGLWNTTISQWVYTLVCLIGLLPIACSAWRLAKSGTPFGIETLMSVAALGALYLGATAEAAMVIVLFMIGERLEGYAASRARSGVQSLMALVPDTAVRLNGHERQSVSASELQPGDWVEVTPGSRLPADGRLLDNVVSVDESALTGESIPVEHQKGAHIAAGCVVVDHVVRIEITSRQGENTIDRILHLMEEAESHKAPLERFLDRFSRWYTPLMLLVGLMVVFVPPIMFAQPWDTWLYRGLATLLIACPCALVISTPAAITSGLATVTKHGALVKGGAALEQLGNVDVVAFDKTGTLTQGNPQVTDVLVVGNMDEQRLVSYVAAIETGSSHPLATALIRYAQENKIAFEEAEQRSTQAGQGVRGHINGVEYQLVSPRFCPASAGWDSMQQIESQGKTVACVLRDGELVGAIAWQDTIRAEAKQAIEQLQQLGIRSVMLTGDNERSAAGIAQQLGIDYQAQLLPEDKVKAVRKLARTHRVAMIGDGINDAPAMKAAHIGIAMGNGTDVALDTADAALTHSRLTALASMIVLSRATVNNIKQNVSIALGLKAIFLVTSILGMTGLWLAVLADSGATALVTMNALRLLRHKSS
ncbi:zinc/cadmium/mercury/lead-transporting ATPase [Vibrio zhugei]|uniref:P-type Zn(2+) transporter n=1 Tax=Vibrio zhugei TaxID=2479546 RepID=A0ABV7C6W1_9VIBR|nr:zinc/cadmium/mercury/lead-transporting ATPase [Vibrio zhugei]